MNNVLRIERGIAFFVKTNADLTAEQRNVVSALLHDRMIESVFDSVDEADRLFIHGKSRPLLSVDILMVVEQRWQMLTKLWAWL